MVLHDLNLASRFADHIALLACGRGHTTGAPAEVLTFATIEDATASKRKSTAGRTAPSWSRP
ncbi:MAG TPA: hypothetical protein VEZ44_10545, partial [bacterium]|nr:hypothetical protein [bacterium]